MWIHRVHGSAHSQMARFGLNHPLIDPPLTDPLHHLRHLFLIFETWCANIELTNTALPCILRYTAPGRTTSKLADLPISKHCSGSLPFRLVKVKQKYLGPAAIQTNDANPCVRVTDMTLAESESHLIQPIFGCENLGHWRKMGT